MQDPDWVFKWLCLLCHLWHCSGRFYVARVKGRVGQAGLIQLGMWEILHPHIYWAPAVCLWLCWVLENSSKLASSAMPAFLSGSDKSEPVMSWIDELLTYLEGGDGAETGVAAVKEGASEGWYWLKAELHWAWEAAAAEDTVNLAHWRESGRPARLETAGSGRYGERKSYNRSSLGHLRGCGPQSEFRWCFSCDEICLIRTFD